MISLRLEKKINSLCDSFKKESILFKQGYNKKITEFQVATYVKSLEQLFKLNCVHMLKASEVYSDNPKLKNYFLEKWSEEDGHDTWARMDWVAMSKNMTFETEPVVLPEMMQLLEFLELTMKTNPYRYIAYFFHAEYMTTILGPIWLRMIEDSLSIKPSEVSSLSKHIELDGDHALAVGKFLDSFDLAENICEDILSFSGLLQQKYNLFFNALAETNDERIYNSSQNTARELPPISSNNLL